PLPLRAPLLTAWAGGPKAARLSGKRETLLVRAAVESVSEIFGRAVAHELAAAYLHDWRADPYARGGYSYVRVNGQGAREALAAPLGGTLFFAGEATESEEPGTVA